MRKESFDLNPLQRAYWLGRSREIEWGGNSCNAAFEIDVKDLEVDKLKSSLNQVARAHPMLNMVVEPGLKQRYSEDTELPFRFYRAQDLDNVEEFIEDTRKEMKYEIIPDGKRMFDFRVLQLNGSDYKIFVKIDMIFADLSSMYIFGEELSRAYGGEKLTEYGIGFREYLEQLEEYKKTDEYRSHAEYWEKRLDDFPGAPELPLKIERISEEKPLYVRRERFLSEKRWKRFCSTAAKLGLTPSAALLSLYSQVLSAWGGGSRFAISVTSSLRKNIHPDIQRIIGEFTGVILLETNIRNQSLKDDAAQLQKQLWMDIEHAAYDGVEVLKDIYRLTGEARIYPVVFTSGIEVEHNRGSNIFAENISWCESTTPQVVMDHQVFPMRGGVLLSWDCMDSAFMPDVVDSMFDQYIRLVLRCTDSPEVWGEPLKDPRPSGSADIQKQVNCVPAEWGDTVLHKGIFKRAIAEPGRTAVVSGNRAWTYGELKARADAVAALMESRNIPRGRSVLICQEYDFDAVAVILGILSYGCSYVPVTPDQPDVRIREIYNKAEGVALFLDSPDREIEGCSCLSYRMANPGAKASEYTTDQKEVAYTIFTSGSTGKPKGVVITHDAAMNTILDVNRRNGIGEDDRCIALSALNFDLSVYDIFGLLNSGGSMVIPSQEERLDPRLMGDLCEKHGVTVWNTVPVFMKIYLDYLVDQGLINRALRKVMLSGDWIPMDLFGKMERVTPDADLVSMGGATEASIWSNYYNVKEIHKEWKSIPYGYPLSNQQFYVLDTFKRPCPDYVTGRLHIAGRGLAEGYLNDSELTDRAFFHHPESDIRLYDTGDYGRYDSNGVIEFLGRLDTQVKVNGYRIELGDIESAFHKIGIPEVVIIAYGDKMENKKLLGFVKSREELKESWIAEKLKDLLPLYCVPEKIFVLKEFPVTSNNKIDRKKLCSLYKKPEKRVVTEDEKGVIAVVADALGLDSLSPSDSFAAIGVSSLEIINLANRLEAEYGFRPPVGDMMKYPDLGALMDFYSNAEESSDRENSGSEEFEVDEAIEDSDMELVLENMSYSRIKELLESRRIDDEKQIKRLEDELKNRTEAVMDELAVLGEVERILGLSDIQSSDNLFQLGVSSVEIINLANKLEEKYLVRPSVVDMMKYNSLRELIEFYSEKQEEIKRLYHLKRDEETDREDYRREEQIINRCSEQNIRLWAEGGKLKYKAEQGAMTRELMTELKLHKDGLVEFLSKQESGEVAGRVFKLTPIQLAYIVGRESVYELGNVNAHYYIEFKVKDINREGIEKAVNKVIANQEGLRTLIYDSGTQEVMKDVPYYNVKELKIEDEAERSRLREEWSHRSYKPGTWPMFELFLTRDSSEDPSLHISLDCLILDGWSVRMFMSQVFAEYFGESPDYPGYSFREYLHQEKSWIASKSYHKEAVDYWEEHIKTIPPAPAFDYKKPLDQIDEPRYARMEFAIPKRDLEVLNSKSKSLRVTLSAVVCTAYMKLLAEKGLNPDVSLNLTLFNRLPLHEKVAEVLGDFTNITLLSYYSDEQKSFAQQVASVQEELWRHIEYRSYDGVSLLRKMVGSDSRKAVMPFVFTSMMAGEVSEGKENIYLDRIEETFAISQTPQVVLDHQLRTRNEELYFNWDYVTEAFDKEELSEMFEEYRRVIDSLVKEDWDSI